jgi:hypothetical protein
MTNRVYRLRRNKYNPYWIDIIRKTKIGIDKKDWIDFILAWKACVDDDFRLFENLKQSWKKSRRISSKELRQLSRDWKLLFNPTIGNFRGLARSNTHLFRKIKVAIRAQGEGETCWACGTILINRNIGLNAHEFWDYDFKRRIRKLTAVRFLCTDCHYLTHNGNVMFLPIPNENLIRLTELFCRVNNCKLIEAYIYFTFLCKDHFSEDTRIWKTDLAYIEGLLGELSHK